MSEAARAPQGHEVRRVIADSTGDIARITLDRFEALNALSWPMVRHLSEALDEFEGTAAAIVLDSSHPKAFCAGGDIRAIRGNTLAGAHVETHDFFEEEYALNERIANFPVPIVSLIDGVCMGGGMGLAIHGGARIVTERAVMAMPETAIGFFPDVGSSFFLSRLPGALGRYWGLTGARISPGDAVYSGLGTHYIGSITAEDLVAALANRGDASVAEVLDRLAEPRPESAAERERERIDRVFGAPTLAELTSRLDTDDSEWGRNARELLAAASPQSLAITQALLTWAADEPLRSCLDAELALTDTVTRTPDFVEGVRAVLVDKDRTPSWSEPRFRGLDAEGRARWEAGAPVGDPVPAR